MRKTLTAIAILSICGAASATYCPDGSTIESHPNNNCNYKEPKKNGIDVDMSAEAKAQAQAAAKQKQQQQQQQAQLQQQTTQQRLDNRIKNTAGGASVSISGNAAGSGDSSNFTAWAPIIPAPAAPAIASANLVVVPGVCGPRVRIITTQVMGQHYGPAGGQYEVVRTYNESIGPYLDENGNPDVPFVNRGGYLIGNMVTQAWATVGTSSAAGFSIGGFVDAKGLQGGANASGAVQQLVKSLQVTDCVMPTVQPQVIKPTYKPRPRPVRRVAPAPVPCLQLCTIPK